MVNAYFDIQAYYVALDEIRKQRGITWNQFFRETGIQRKNLRKAPSVHTLATLAIWSGLDVTPFMKLYSE